MVLIFPRATLAKPRLARVIGSLQVSIALLVDKTSEALLAAILLPFEAQADFSPLAAGADQ